MLFNTEKCKIMEVTRNRKSCACPELTLSKGDPPERHILAVTALERDLGVNISSNMKFDDHISLITVKANRILGQLKRTFKFWTVHTFKILYTAFIGPHLSMVSLEKEKHKVD